MLSRLKLVAGSSVRSAASSLAGPGRRTGRVVAHPGQLLAGLPQRGGQRGVAGRPAGPGRSRRTAHAARPLRPAVNCPARPSPRRTAPRRHRPPPTGRPPGPPCCAPAGPGSGPHPVRAEHQVGPRHAGVGGGRGQRHPLFRGPPLQLEGEQQVGELGAGIGPLRVVAGLRLTGQRHRPRHSSAAIDDTVTTRDSPAASSAGSSRPVSAKWPRWLVPNCSSKPSEVRRNRAAPSPRRC